MHYAGLLSSVRRWLQYIFISKRKQHASKSGKHRRHNLPLSQKKHAHNKKSYDPAQLCQNVRSLKNAPKNPWESFIWERQPITFTVTILGTGGDKKETIQKGTLLYD